MILPYDEKDYEARCAGRPPEFRAAAEACVVKRAGGKVYVDRSRPQWQTVLALAKSHPQPRGIRRLAHGVAGIAKAVAGIDPAPEDVVKARTDTCLACDQVKTTAAGLLLKCGACGCAVRLKVKVKGEKCPLGKW